MILEIIVLAIFIATVFNIVLHKFQMPTIIGYILTWAIISHLFWLGDLVTSDEIRTFAEFGIVFLMFTIGLDFPLKHSVNMKKNVFLFWSMQFFITSILFYFLSMMVFWLESRESIIISLWFSLSSTAIVFKILNENWWINKNYWNRSLWILIFHDLMVIPILLLITVYSTINANVWELLGKTFINAVILFSIFWIISRFFLDHFLYKVAKTNSNEIFIWSILFIVIWSSALAHSLGFTYSLWAFLAGILIAKTHYKNQFEADLIPFRDLLLWFFFLTVWMLLNFEVIYKNFWTILILLSWLIIIKISILHAILTWFTHKRSAFKTALSLFQFWEFGIVVFELAIIKNLLDPHLWQILIVVIILSMFITPVVLKNLTDITDFLFWYKYLDIHGQLITKKLSNHVVLVWYWRLGKILWNFLENKWMDYIILENNIATYKEAKKHWKPIIFWNAFQANTLKSVNIEDAWNIIISIWTSEKLFLIANVIKKMNIKWNIVVKVNTFNEETVLKELGITDIIVETEKTALAMFEKVKLV
jgi:monovalent cation:H+ antiporter-2, CPA2 family